MDKIYPKLKAAYERWCAKVSEDPYSTPRTIGIRDVLRAHYLLCDYFIREGESIALSGPKNLDLLISAVSRQFTRYESYAKWTNDLELCATLFYGLIKNHAFHDGNKRTALLVCLLHLWKLGRVPDILHKELENLAVRTAGNDLDRYEGYARFEKCDDPEVRFLAESLKRHTRLMDKREYTITYNQLSAKLDAFGLKLQNPHGNRIDVVREEHETYWKGMRRKKRLVTKKVVTIGFPGWTKEVPKAELARLRKEAGLTHADGIDSEVFYRNEDPLQILIAHYHGVLKRLKDR